MARTFPTRQVVAHHVDRTSERVALEMALPIGEPAIEVAAGVAAATAGVPMAPLRAMVLGVDGSARVMPVAEVAEFGDPFTRNLLLAGVVPMTVTALD